MYACYLGFEGDLGGFEGITARELDVEDERRPSSVRAAVFRAIDDHLGGPSLATGQAGRTAAGRPRTCAAPSCLFGSSLVGNDGATPIRPPAPSFLTVRVCSDLRALWIVC
jgi:hypothetical protein